MIERILSAVSAFLLTAVASVAANNLLMTRGFGAERVTRHASGSESRKFNLLQAAGALLAGVGFWLVNRFLLPHVGLLEGFGVSEWYARAFLWPVAAVFVLAGVFFLLFVACVKLAPYDRVMELVQQLPGSLFNSFVAGVLLLSASQQYTLARTVAVTLGNCAGYALVCFLLRQASRKLQNREMPAAFRGLPSLLLYLSGVAMAAFALSGHGFSDLL